jgi:polar amino acid transport system substrate-binding protein
MNRFLHLALASALAGCPGFGQPLRIYTEIAPPNQSLDPSGKLTGFAVELVREIQKRIGNQDPIEVLPWVRAYKALESEPNVMLFSMARSAKRDPLFRWVGPISESRFTFYVKADSAHDIKDLDDARKLRLIGVYKEDARDQYLSKLGFTNLDRSLDEEVMLKKLMDGRIDALAGSPIGMEQVAKAIGVRFEELKEAYTFQKVQVYIAFSRTTPSPIVASWSSTLNAMKKDKSFEAIFRKYYPTGPLPGAVAKPF